MGWGDELMAAGDAQTLYDRDPSRGPVAICDINDRPRTHALWAGNPAVWKPESGPFTPDIPTVRNAKFCRPYIQYPFTSSTGWTWATGWRARDHRGKLYFTDAERRLGDTLRQQYGPYLLIEPTPVRGNKNRRWPHDRWELLALAAQQFGLPVLQLYHPAADMMPSTTPVPHNGFREACAVVASATVFVSTEGGLVHAAAALGTSTVALFGGCVSEPVLGYPEHINLVDDSPETPCGTWAPCAHCTTAWDRLHVTIVLRAIDDAFTRKRQRAGVAV